MALNKHWYYNAPISQVRAVAKGKFRGVKSSDSERTQAKQAIKLRGRESTGRTRRNSFNNIFRI